VAAVGNVRLFSLDVEIADASAVLPVPVPSPLPVTEEPSPSPPREARFRRLLRTLSRRRPPEGE
jgi:hypothetical protein